MIDMTGGPRVQMQSQEKTLTADVSGVASGAITKVEGEIIGVLITLGSGMTSAVVTLTSDTGQVVLSGVTVSTTHCYVPRLPATINDGSTAVTNSYIPYIAGGSVTFAIASGVSTKTITARIFFK